MRGGNRAFWHYYGWLVVMFAGIALTAFTSEYFRHEWLLWLVLVAVYFAGNWFFNLRRQKHEEGA